MKFIVLFIACLLYGPADVRAQVAVIAHRDVPADTVASAQLLDFYTGDLKFWKDGTPIVALDLKPKSAIKKAFYKFLGKSSARMKSIWLKRLLSGEGDPPEAFKSEEELLRKVAATPGAVGFVAREKVDGKVKILAIIEENK